jgi:hypothetical protein
MRLRPDGSASDVVFMTVAEQIRRLRERLVQAEAQRAAQINAVDESNLAGAAKKNALLRPLHSWQLAQAASPFDPSPRHAEYQSS